MEKQLEQLIISPAIWPGKILNVQPGDLSKFAPQGNRAYGFQTPSFEPIKGASEQEEAGGIVYFGNRLEKKDFEGFLRMINVRADDKDYAAFIQESSNPCKDQYFKQMRLVSKFGLQYMFHAIDEKEYKSFKEQSPTAGDALWKFMDSEKRRLGTGMGDPRISGKMGGDGDYAKEMLSFGFMLENEYYQIYRIWSRAWLVTK